MKAIFTTAFAILVSLSSFADGKDEQNKIVGTWELLDVTSVTVADSPPRGLPSIKHYYAPDGKMYSLAANEMLTGKTDSAPYVFSNGVRALKTQTGRNLQTKIDFPSTNTMRYLFNDGNQIWTFSRMLQEKAYNVEIEPRSVVVLRTVDKSNQLTCFDVKYDTNDYSKLPLEQRCVGAWETVEYKGVPITEMPPYGFPNDKLVFTKNGRFSKVAPAETPSEWSKYEVTNTTIIVWDVDEKGSQKFEKVRFDKWNRMVLPYKDVELTLKLLQRDTTKIPILPGKICLLEPE